MRYVEDAHDRVLAAAKDMLRRGLVEGTAGNISARQQDGNIVITPSSVDYADMQLDDLVVIDPDGATLACKEGRSPSSERMLHLACYRAFDDVGSVPQGAPDSGRKQVIVGHWLTFGYGDVVMSAPSRLWGAPEAADRSLMFSLSSTMTFAVIVRLIRRRHLGRRVFEAAIAA